MVSSLSNKNPLPLVLGIAVFLGAFLLFLIEPVVGKIVIPRFGGTASVWNICLLFFQLTLLLGYALSAALNRLEAKRQIAVYLALTAFSACFAAIPAAALWRCDTDIDPSLSLLQTLFANVAVPVILLSTVSGIMQVWFRLARLGDPYRLYSISNFSSMLALLAYPSVIESRFTIGETLSHWFALFLCLVVVIGSAGVLTWKRLESAAPLAESPLSQEQEPGSNISESAGSRVGKFAFWTSFSALGSAVLMSSTAYITSDISPMPLLWVLPLAIYLMSFILVFGDIKTYKRVPYLASWMLIVALEELIPPGGFVLRMVLNLVLIFQMCMICNGELALSKPHAERLTTFYLALALGGFIGGLLVAIVAPLVFEFNAERIIVLYILAVYSVYQLSVKKFLARPNKTLGYISLLIVLISVVVASWSLGRAPNVIHRERNFYSAVQVKKEGDSLVMYHGKVNHGQQFILPSRQDEPSGVYWWQVGVIDEFMRQLRAGGPLRYGDVGLGVGVLCIYGRPGDTIDYFELDPKVLSIARKYFTFLARSKAKVDVSIGDGRAILEKLPPQKFDILIIDAFNGDAVPCHLLTKEAVTVYEKHLKADGLLVFHVSNLYLDLAPLLGNLARDLGMKSCIILKGGVTYVAMSRSPETIAGLIDFVKSKRLDANQYYIGNTPCPPGLKVWSDDQSNLMSVLRLQ